MSDLFTPLERAAWGGFVVAQSRVFASIEEHLKQRFGLTHTEFEVLLRLTFRSGGRARIQDLAAQSLLSRSGTSRAVDRLARGGYLERHDAEEDGRGAYAVLTEEGRSRFMTAAREHVEVVRKAYLSRFTVAEQRVLAGLWARFDQAAADAGAAPSEVKARRSRRAPRRSPRRG